MRCFLVVSWVSKSPVPVSMNALVAERTTVVNPRKIGEAHAETQSPQRRNAESPTAAINAPLRDIRERGGGVALFPRAVLWVPLLPGLFGG
jgi:hypothetical protein